MNQTRWVPLIGLALITLILAACGGQADTGGGLPAASGDPSPGTFEGSTSQGKPITLFVDEIGGVLTVTGVRYEIEMQADGWSVTTELVQPHTLNAAIEDGRFSSSTDTTSGTEEISARFSGDEGVEGRLRCTHDHPQGLGTAEGDVTFTAFRVAESGGGAPAPVEEQPVQEEPAPAAVNPEPGTYEGSTSQGSPFSLEVAESDGGLAVTGVLYEIEMAGQGWSVTTTLYQPVTTDIPIEEGLFDGVLETSDGQTCTLSGAFTASDEAEGTFSCAFDHPQGLGTAYGDVTFSVSR